VTWRRVGLALPLLTAVLIRRFLRDGFILRSLLWPAGLTVGTLMATLLVFSNLRQSDAIGITADLDPTLVSRLMDEGWSPVLTPDLESPLRARRVWASTDGVHMWHDGSPRARRLESILRQRADAPWRPAAKIQLPSRSEAAPQGALFTTIVAVMFTLYGIVFGLGMVARDRDDGSLEAELALPIPHWVAGASRWLASTLVLSAFFAFSVLVFDAVIGVDRAPALIRHGIASCGGATALGLISVGRAGLKQGFSGPLAGGLTAAMALMSLGLTLPEIGAYLPLASLLTSGSGWFPLGVSVLLGLLASLVFSVRSARS
jgi:hypothetical protein